MVGMKQVNVYYWSDQNVGFYFANNINYHVLYKAIKTMWLQLSSVLCVLASYLIYAIVST